MNACCALAAMSAGLILLASQANGQEKLHRVGVLAQSEKAALASSDAQVSGSSETLAV
jgi:hypothetical protein